MNDKEKQQNTEEPEILPSVAALTVCSAVLVVIVAVALIADALAGLQSVWLW